MQIVKLYMQNFASAKEREVSFTGGINVLTGKNESGKSTLQTFLRAMLYGLKRSRGRGAASDDFSRCEPWENPGSYGGILWFESGGKRYRLRRSFAKNHADFELLDETEGRLLGEEDLRGILGGVSEQVFLNTVCIGQMKTAAGADLAGELTEYMARCGETKDLTISLNRALRTLQAMKKHSLDEKAKRQREAERVRERLLLAGEEQRELIRELEEKKALLDAGENRIGDREGEEGLLLRMEALTKRRRALGALLLLFTGALILLPALGALGFLRLPAAPLAALLLFGALLSLLSLRAFQRAGRRLDRLKRQSRRLSLRRERLIWEKKSLSESLDDARARLAQLGEEMEELGEQMQEEGEEDLQAGAYSLAIETLTGLKGLIGSSVGREMRLRVSQILEEITDGRYRELIMDERLHVTVLTGERAVPLERLSRGTIEQVYFSLRMAASEILCAGEPFPILLDEVFAMYDDERLGAVLCWLATRKRQVILSSCSRREEELLGALEIPFHRICLPDP